MRKSVVVFLVCQVLLGQSACAGSSADVSAVYRANVDAVVAIDTLENSVVDTGFSGNFSAPGQRHGLGSGFIISEDGYVVTNAHVVDGSNQIKVKFKGKRELPAVLVGADGATDIALLKVNGSGLQKVKIGSSAGLEIGQLLIAMGSPFGLGQSLTTGVVSAKDRIVPNKGEVAFIQTDTVINEGNSGGPLFDDQGTVVGVNSWIYSHSGRYEGMSFAVPIDLAMNVVEQLKKSPKILHGWLGIKTEDASLSMPEAHGALILNCAPASPAHDAGLRRGDVVITFNQQTIKNSPELHAKVKKTAAGTWIELGIVRQGERQLIKVKVGSDPKS